MRELLHGCVGQESTGVCLGLLEELLTGRGRRIRRQALRHQQQDAIVGAKVKGLWGDVAGSEEVLGSVGISHGLLRCVNEALRSRPVRSTQALCQGVSTAYGWYRVRTQATASSGATPLRTASSAMAVPVRPTPPSQAISTRSRTARA